MFNLFKRIIKFKNIAELGGEEIEIIQLTKEDYNSTFSNKMIDVTNSTEPIVEIWPYVEELSKRNIINTYVSRNKLVELVYQNEQNTFHHILLPTEDKNIFVVILVNLLTKKIKGHFILDLNKEYGLE